MVMEERSLAALICYWLVYRVIVVIEATLSDYFLYLAAVYRCCFERLFAMKD